MKVILTHDIDSISKPFKHIWARRRRFSIKDLFLAAFRLKNIYNNIEDVIAIEDKYGFRSTFFVPTTLFNLFDIIDILKRIIKEGWEVQLHYVYESIQPEGLFRMQKNFFEKNLGKVLGVRTHMLIINEALIKLFKNEGLIYDSSYRIETARRYDPFFIDENFVEIPIGIMDADLFGRLKLNEKDAWKYILWKIRKAEEENAEYFTILFHQESYRMKGGRLYKDLLKFIAERGYESMRCIDTATFLIRR